MSGKKERSEKGVRAEPGPMAWWIILGAATALAAALATSIWYLQGPRANPGDAVQVARGKAVYAQHCASCHGLQLEGQPDWRIRRPDGRLPAPPHDDTGHTWHHSDELLFDIVKHGLTPPRAPPGYESDMPAYAGVLTDDEIRAVLAYIKSRWSDRVLAARREMLGGRR